MREYPDDSALLDALSAFLEGPIREATAADAALSFRARIAAQLARVVAADLRTRSERVRADLEGLAALLPEIEVEGTEAERARALNRALARLIRDGRIGGEALARARAEVLRSLAADLAVSSPRFERSFDIE